MKKRTLSLLCAAVLLMTAMLPVAALANVHHAYVYTSNGKSLNMRKAPITHADNKIANVPYGAEVIVHEYVNSNTWAYVEYNGKQGYVMSRYLTNAKPSPKPSSGGDSGSGDVSFKNFVQTDYMALVRASAPGGWVNLRWAPSKKMAVRERVYDGQKLEVIAQNETWAQVRDPETEIVGFMMRAFLTVLGSGAES